MASGLQNAHPIGRDAFQPPKRRQRLMATAHSSLLQGVWLLQSACQLRDSRGMNEITGRPCLRIRIVFGDDEMIGPGKAELLERVDRCGSIAAAGREMRMSYKRAWQLIGTLNAMFREPLVESTRGGTGGGGAVLTGAGRTVLDLYRAFEVDAAEAGAARLEEIRSLLRDIPDRP